MESLRSQARFSGGDVLSHLGNHEVMNAIGGVTSSPSSYPTDKILFRGLEVALCSFGVSNTLIHLHHPRYVFESEIKTFGSVAERQKVLSKGWIGAAWRTNYTITSRLPLHPSLGPPNTDYVSSDSSLSHAALSFVHGGISPTFLQSTPYPSRINKIGSSLLSKLQRRKQPPPHPPHPYPGLPIHSNQDEHELYGSNGPLWYRGWALEDESKVCKEIDNVLDKTGTRRLIMGHTPTFERQVSRCGGKIIIIDTYAFTDLLSMRHELNLALQWHQPRIWGCAKRTPN